jgi:hypothetical protein
MDDDASTVIRQAQLIIYQASWHIMEEAALASLADTRGLQRAPLDVRSQVIQLVTFDGQYLGRIRRDTTPGTGECWVAVRLLTGGIIGLYQTPDDAAEALAAASGKHIRGHS